MEVEFLGKPELKMGIQNKYMNQLPFNLNQTHGIKVEDMHPFIGAHRADV